jgi:hypothetical protein
MTDSIREIKTMLVTRVRQRAARALKVPFSHQLTERLRFRK